MKNTIHLIVLTICIVTTVHSQDILWEKSYGGKHADYLMDAIPTTDYGFILAGSSLSKKTGNKTENNVGDLDYWVWKMDENGELDWQKNFGGTGSDFLQSIKNTKDGGFILAGTSNSSNEDDGTATRNDKQEACRGGDDFWILKLDAKGNQEWQKTIGGMGQEKLQSIFQTKDGGYILGGSSSSSKPYQDELGEKATDSFGNMDYWVVKIDTKGKIQWQKTFGGIYMDELRSIEQSSDGGYIVGGYSNSPSSSSTSTALGETNGNKTEDNKGIGDFWVLKLDNKGEIIWQRTIGGNQDDQLYVVHQTYDGNFIVGGNSNSDSSNEKSKGNESGTDFWVLKLGQEGEILWQETYNIGKIDVLTSLVENDDHSLLLGGFAQSSTQTPLQRKGEKDGIVGKGRDRFVPRDDKGINDYVAIKITENGEEIWRQSVGSAGEDLLKKVFETRDGGYLMAGTSNVPSSTLPTRAIANWRSKGKGANNMVAKNSRDRNSSIGSNDFWVVKLRDKNKSIKVKVVIEALPNPATTFTNVIIGYDYESGTATLVDLAGHVLQQFEITSRTVPVDLSHYPTGIYVVNIRTNKGNDGVKVIKGL